MGKGRKITQSNSNNFCLLRTQQPDNVEGKDKRQQTNLDKDNTNALIGYWENTGKKKRKEKTQFSSNLKLSSYFWLFQLKQNNKILNRVERAERAWEKFVDYRFFFNVTKHCNFVNIIKVN